MVRFEEPEMTPETVPVSDVATWIVVSADSATVPETVPDALNRNAPVPASPIPANVNDSAVEIAALIRSVAPFETVVAPVVLPKLLSLVMSSTPVVIATAPEYEVFAPDKVSVPVPDFVKAPDPETTPEIVPVLPDATCTVESAVSATVPPAVPLSEKYNAPVVPETPVPDKVNGSDVV